MKIYRSIALWAFLSLLIGMLQAQDRTGLFLGVGSDLFSVPLTESGMLARATAVNAGYAISPSVNVYVSWENRLLLDPGLSLFESNNGLGLGAGYRLGGNLRPSSVELNLQVVKGLDNFTSSDNLSARAGVRWLFTDSFYIGTGLGYESWESTILSAGSKSTYNWYCQLGLRIFTGKRK